MNSLITDENKLQKKYTPAISADQVIPTEP